MCSSKRFSKFPNNDKEARDPAAHAYPAPRAASHALCYAIARSAGCRARGKSPERVFRRFTPHLYTNNVCQKRARARAFPDIIDLSDRRARADFFRWSQRWFDRLKWIVFLSKDCGSEVL